MSRGPISLFHAAAEREKEAAKQHHVEMIKEGQVNIFEVKENKGANAMLEQVITKLKTEMDAKRANAYVQGIGQQMIEFLQAHPAIAEQLTDETKTIEGSYQAVATFVRGKTDNRGMATPQEAFEAIMSYYGVQGATFVMPVVSLSVSKNEDSTTVQAPPVIEKKEEPVSKKTKFSASLEDFL